MNEDQILSRIVVLENRQQRTYQVAGLLVIVLVGAIVFQSRQIRSLQNPQKLRVRELAVVDEHGTERVLIAAPLPRGKRGGTLSGIIISDPTGTERGAYATADGGYANAVFTLDGQGFQTVLLLAEPDGSTMFRIWDQDRGSVTMGVEDHSSLSKCETGWEGAVYSTCRQSRESRPAPLVPLGHYFETRMYMRLNGVLPPTAKK